MDNEETGIEDTVQQKIHKTFEDKKNALLLNNDVINSMNNSITTMNLEPFQSLQYTAPPENKTIYTNKTPGIIEGAAHEFKNWNSIGQAVSSYEKGQALKPSNDLYDNPSDDPIPDNWNPSQNRDMYLNTKREFWDSLSNAKSPKDQEARYKYAQDQMAQEDYFANGSIVQKILSKSLGIVGGIVLDPVNLVPIAASMKYLKLSQNFLRTALKVAPTMAAIESTRQVVDYINDPDLSAHEAGYNAIRDTVTSTFLFAGMAGLGRGFEGYKLHQLNRSQNFNFEGMGVKFDVSDTGAIIGYKSAPVGNKAANAAEVTRHQEYLDSAFKKGGLFWLPGVTKATSLLSPIVRGLSSKNGAIRALTNRLADHDIATVGGNKHVPDSQSFEKRMMNIEGQAQTFGLQMEGLRKEYNGINFTASEEDALKQLNSNLNKKDPSDPTYFWLVSLASYRLAY